MQTLQDTDEEFRDNHIQIITRFYLAFESIHTFVVDLDHYLEELDDGLFIHQTLETVFADVEGKQLLVSSLRIYFSLTYSSVAIYYSVKLYIYTA